MEKEEEEMGKPESPGNPLALRRFLTSPQGGSWERWGWGAPNESTAPATSLHSLGTFEDFTIDLFSSEISEKLVHYPDVECPSVRCKCCITTG